MGQIIRFGFKITPGFFLIVFCLISGTVRGQDSTDLAVNPRLILDQAFTPDGISFNGYRLGDDVFNVMYDPIVSTSFSYSEVPLREQIERVEKQGGILWMNDGTGLVIRNSRIAEFRLTDSLIAKHFGWKAPADLFEDMGNPDVSREDSFMPQAIPDYMDYFWEARKVRVRFSPKIHKFKGLAVGGDSNDPVWD